MTDDLLEARVAAVERALTDGSPVADLSDAAELQRQLDDLAADLDTLGERVSFEVEATVGVVVPAGPRGVGDTSGGQDEQSPGWQTQPP